MDTIVPKHWNGVLLTWRLAIERCRVPLLTNNAQTENVEVNEDVVASEGLKDVNVNEEVPVDFNVNETVNVNEEVPEDVIGSEGLKDGEAFNVNDEVPINVIGSEGLKDGVPVNVNVNEEVPVDVDNGQVDDEAEDDSDGSVDSMRGVHFDDSEEERALGADDGFNHAEAELNEKGETSGVDRDGGIEGSRGNVDGFTPANVQNMYIMDEEYESDELLSGAETSDGEARPKYLRCKQLGHNSKSCKLPPPVNGDDVTEDTAAGTQQSQHGKKKLLPTGPVIPEFARHMSVGQLQHHIDIVKASALEQAAALAVEDASHPVTTSADQAHASTIPPAQPPQTPSAQAQAPAKKGKESGESSQRNDSTKG
ncbi:hypothetical protein SESBI_19877 [Sesbania bispinosa]|nr:hypothetical protein SESBI_19877 [Sesbania bispinosa]